MKLDDTTSTDASVPTDSPETAAPEATSAAPTESGTATSSESEAPAAAPEPTKSESMAAKRGVILAVVAGMGADDAADLLAALSEEIRSKEGKLPVDVAVLDAQGARAF